MRALHQRYGRSTADFIREKAGQGQSTPWQAVYHAAGRLLSYLDAVKALLHARRLWPELFVNFQVIPVAAASPDHTPLKIQTSADSIIARTTNDHTILTMYRRSSHWMKMLSIDECIANMTRSGLVALHVHPLVLVDDAIRRANASEVAGGSEPSPFFHEAEYGRYIGNSTPTCKLCALYFAALPERVQVPPSSGVTCPGWRPPDVFEGDHRVVEEQRRRTLEIMIMKMRVEIFKSIRSRSEVSEVQSSAL